MGPERFLVASGSPIWILRGRLFASALLVALACAPLRCAAQSSDSGGAGLGGETNSSAGAPADTPSDTTTVDTPDDSNAPNPADDHTGPDASAADSPATTAARYSPTGSTAPPTPAAIESWLASGDSRLVAWGAHYAAASHDENAIPALTALAGRWETLAPAGTNDNGAPELSEAQKDTRDAMAGVLDTLIQMNATLPHSTMRDLAHDFPSETAIFLARMPARDSADLRMEFFRDSSRDMMTLRYVAAALLAREPQPGFASGLMSGIRVRVTIHVISPDTTLGGYGTAGDCAYSIEVTRENWPPTPHYKISLDRGDSGSELVGGAQPVSMERVTEGRYQPSACSEGIYLSSERRQNLVAEMLGVKAGSLAWEVEMHHPIAYRSEKQYETDLLAFLNGEIEKQRATATALADKGLITPGDVSDALPEIIVDVSDERGAESPLADVANLPSRVIYSKYYKWAEE